MSALAYEHQGSVANLWQKVKHNPNLRYRCPRFAIWLLTRRPPRWQVAKAIDSRRPQSEVTLMIADVIVDSISSSPTVGNLGSNQSDLY
jgi:hypothetical protein